LAFVQIAGCEPLGLKPTTDLGKLCEQMLNAAEGVTDGDEMNPIVVREGAQRTTRTDEVMLFHCCLLVITDEETASP
jgi:hypothetical protein